MVKIVGRQQEKLSKLNMIMSFALILRYDFLW